MIVSVVLVIVRFAIALRLALAMSYAANRRAFPNPKVSGVTLARNEVLGFASIRTADAANLAEKTARP